MITVTDTITGTTATIERYELAETLTTWNADAPADVVDAIGEIQAKVNADEHRGDLDEFLSITIEQAEQVSVEFTHDVESTSTTAAEVDGVMVETAHSTITVDEDGDEHDTLAVEADVNGDPIESTRAALKGAGWTVETISQDGGWVTGTVTR